MRLQGTILQGNIAGLNAVINTLAHSSNFGRDTAKTQAKVTPGRSVFSILEKRAVGCFHVGLGQNFRYFRQTFLAACDTYEGSRGGAFARWLAAHYTWQMPSRKKMQNIMTTFMHTGNFAITLHAEISGNLSHNSSDLKG